MRARLDAFTNEAATERRVGRRHVISILALLAAWGVPMAQGSSVRQVSLDDLAKEAFETHADGVSWRESDGRPIKPWLGLSEKERDAWRSSTRKVYERSKQIDSLLITL